MLPLPRLLLFPALTLSLLLLLEPWFVVFILPLRLGGSRTRHLLDLFPIIVRVTYLVRVLLLLEQRLALAWPLHDNPLLNIVLRVPFPDACLQQMDHMSFMVGSLR